MLEIVVTIAVLVGIAVVVVIAVAARKPDSFRIQRSTGVNASPERIFPLIASLRSMNTWSPFVDPDPAIKISYSGPESGKGATHTWSGNSKVGEGRIEITETTPPSKVAMQLDMVKPMKASNAVEFTLLPNGSGTTVTWAMSGRQPFLAKLMSIFIDCDRMVGSQFEKGLASLKALAER